jgi:hypothetical protein
MGRKKKAELIIDEQGRAWDPDDFFLDSHGVEAPEDEVFEMFAELGPPRAGRFFCRMRRSKVKASAPPGDRPPHPENAHRFIDFLLEPAVIAEISNTVGQANGNAASLPLVAESIRNDPAIYPSEEVHRRLAIDRTWSPEQTREVNRAWARIKAGE